MNATPTWQLVLNAARALQRRVGPFRLEELITEVQSVDPSRQRGSVSPVVQGMTRNAGLGPPSPCGKPLRRVGHGVYELCQDVDDPPDDNVPPPLTTEVRHLEQDANPDTMDWRLAGAVDIREALRRLSDARPVFHSEADFQLAFGWQIQQQDPMMRVRLETRPEPRVHLDMHLVRPDTGSSSAVELKYPTRAWAAQIAGESFALKDHGAQDITGYDIVKDIWRVERLISDQLVHNGFVVVVTNDSHFWTPRTAQRDTNAAAFKLNDGSEFAGRRAWGPRTGLGTMRGREVPLDLVGRYTMRWSDYSYVDPADRRSKFRSLIIAVGESTTKG